MKKIILLLATISFLLQSCYSYKVVDSSNSNLEIGKHYKITTNNKKNTYAKIKSISDSTLVLKTKYKEKTIKVTDVKKIEKRKFSIVKTLGVPVIVVAVSAVAISIGMGEAEIGGSFQLPN